MRFDDPHFLFLLALVPLLALRHFRLIPRLHAARPSLRFSQTGRMGRLPGGGGAARHALFALRAAALALFCVALARPQLRAGLADPEEIRGVDIMLALDISGSMSALDMDPGFEPQMTTGFFVDARRFSRLTKTRLDAAKEVAAAFVSGRNNDRIGLVVFSEVDLTRSPLTTDRDALVRILGKVDMAPPEQSGTAIGDALARSLSRLLQAGERGTGDSEEKPGRVVILLTDGEDNASQYHPMTIAKVAASLDPQVKIFTIGIGQTGNVPRRDPRTGQISIVRAGFNEDVLREIARVTDGQYFRAVDMKSLENVFGRINELVPTVLPRQADFRYREVFHFFAMPGLALLLLDILLGDTVWRIFP